MSVAPEHFQRKVPCVVIAGEHPASPVAGDQDLADVLSCVEAVPGRDWMLWLGGRDTGVVQMCEARGVSYHDATPGSVQQVAATLRDKVALEPTGTLLIVVCAPLVYRKKIWWAIGTGAAPDRRPYAFQLWKLLRLIVPQGVRYDLNIQFHPYRFWGGAHRSLPVDLPDAKEHDALQAMLTDEYKARVIVGTIDLSGWRPHHDKSPQIPRELVPTEKRPQEVLGPSTRLGSAPGVRLEIAKGQSRSLSIVGNKEDCRGTNLDAWARRLEELLTRMHVKVDVEVYEAAPDEPLGSGDSGAIVFLRAAALESNSIHRWLAEMTPIPPVTILDPEVPEAHRTPLARWLPTKDDPPCGPAHVLAQARWLERLAWPEPPAPRPDDDPGIFRAIWKVLRPVAGTSREEVWEEVHTRLRRDHASAFPELPPLDSPGMDSHGWASYLRQHASAFGTLIDVALEVYASKDLMFEHGSSEVTLAREVDKLLDIRSDLRDRWSKPLPSRARRRVYLSMSAKSPVLKDLTDRAPPCELVILELETVSGLVAAVGGCDLVLRVDPSIEVDDRPPEVWRRESDAAARYEIPVSVIGSAASRTDDRGGGEATADAAVVASAVERAIAEIQRVDTHWWDDLNMTSTEKGRVLTQVLGIAFSDRFWLELLTDRCDLNLDVANVRGPIVEQWRELLQAASKAGKLRLLFREALLTGRLEMQLPRFRELTGVPWRAKSSGAKQHTPETLRQVGAILSAAYPSPEETFKVSDEFVPRQYLGLGGPMAAVWARLVDHIYQSGKFELLISRVLEDGDARNFHQRLRTCTA